ncbi:MAG: antitoxin Xre-like helix-turn-helix domain-containing protein, partial [Alphaproteobacteria bacterium]
ANSASAIRLFVSVCNAWQLSVKERLALAGGVSKPTYDNWRRGSGGALSRDQFERISLVLGIHKAIRLIFLKEEDADRWLKAENSDDPFGEQSPLTFVVSGGIPQLYALRSYLDAWRGAK